MKSLKIVALFFLCNCVESYSQESKEILICNDAKGKLNLIKSNDFSLNFEGCNLVSFVSFDSSLVYNEHYKVFTIKNDMADFSEKAQYITLKLTREAILFSSLGRTIKLDTVSCGNNYPCEPNREFDVSIDNFMIGLVFSNNNIEKIFLATKYRNINISIKHNNEGYYSWDMETTYVVNDGDPIKKLSMEYISAKPFSIALEDEKMGSVYLIGLKNGRTVVKRMVFVSSKDLQMDTRFLVEYKKNGKLKSSKGVSICTR